MSKKSISQDTRIFLTKRSYEYLAFNKEVSVIVFPLTEEIKNKIEKRVEFKLNLLNYRTNKNTVFSIKYSDIGFYGKLNLSPNDENMKAISEYKWLDRFKNFCHWLYSSFDYKTCSISKAKPQLQYDCYSIPKIMEFIHAVLDYPKEIMIVELYNKDIYEIN